MRNACRGLLAFTLCSAALAGLDPRNIIDGIIMVDDGYADQPYCVVNTARDGEWNCVVTVGPGKEGAVGEKLVSIVSVDGGKSWSSPVELEPNVTLTSAYGNIVANKEGRIFTVYNFNEDNVTRLPDGKPVGRTDSLGHFVMKWSDDGGRSWSPRRYEVPFPTTALDKNNSFSGKVDMMWSVDHFKVFNGTTATFAFTKIGTYPYLPPEEIYILTSENLLIVEDPATATWRMLPDGPHGLAPPGGNPNIVEEGHVLPLQETDGFYAVARTTQGYLAAAWTPSHDETGWPADMSFAVFGDVSVDPSAPPTASTRKIKNPRGPITMKRLPSGLLLLLHYFNSHSDYTNRNPYWLSSGREVGGIIVWSEPEIALYSTDETSRPGYPDILEANGNVFITETQKTTARVHTVDPRLVAGLRDQSKLSQLAQVSGLSTNITRDDQGKHIPAPTFPSLSSYSSDRQGLTIELNLQNHQSAQTGSILLSTLSDGVGIKLSVSSDGGVTAYLSDGNSSVTLKTLGACSTPLASQGRHSFALTADAGSSLVVLLVDGVVCDGGADATEGWARMSLDNVNANDMTIGSGYLPGEIVGGRVWTRFLTTSELIGNFRFDNTVTVA